MAAFFRSRPSSIMFERSSRLAAICALTVACCALAPLAAAQQVQVRDAWARATAPGQKTAGVYLEIVSAADAALVGVHTARAGRAELHETRMENGVMRMRAVGKIALPAGKTVKLAPGGLHIMLTGLSRPLAEKETLPLEVTIESTGGVTSKLTVEVAVRGAGGHSHAH